VSLFEYLAIAFSIIFSLSAMRVISGLPHTLRAGGRYWIHATWVWLQLLSTVIVFWDFWSFSHVQWTLPKFVLALIAPGLIYLNTCTLIPERAESVESWKDYYVSVSRRYFLGLGALMAATVANSTVFLDIPLTHPLRILQLVFAAFCAAGVLSTSPKVHAGIAVGSAGFALTMVFLVARRPGVFFGFE
jgi:hypothetical protein